MTMQSEDTTPERLARIETKIDQLLERTGEDRVDFKTRIRQLEHWRYGTGAAMVMSLMNVVLGSSTKGQP
jgi:hypothetical protein